MSNIFVLNYKLQEEFKTIRFIIDIYQYKIHNIILLKSSLYMPPKNKLFTINIPSLILK